LQLGDDIAGLSWLPHEWAASTPVDHHEFAVRELEPA
jgi:hypothetical protein